MIEYKEIKDCCSVVVAKRKGETALMGRDLMKNFGFYIAEINSITANEKINQTIEEYKDLFNDELGEFKGEIVDLKMKEGIKPIFMKPRPIPFAFKGTVDSELDRLEKLKIITKIDSAEWGTPFVPILKPDGKIRVCADYKVTFNKGLEDVKHPLARIEELFAALQGGEHFTVLDMSRTYNQLKVSEKTQLLLAWSTHRGIYAMNRLPFGTKPAAAIFQQVMGKILQRLDMVKNFLDDIVVTGKTTQEHIENLIEVFKRLRKAGLKLNLVKCKFFQNQVEYLGHIIDKEGLRKKMSKVEAIVKMAESKNITQVKAFIVMVNYYAKCIPNLAEKLRPMYKLLQKTLNFNGTMIVKKVWN